MKKTMMEQWMDGELGRLETMRMSNAYERYLDDALAKESEYLRDANEEQKAKYEKVKDAITMAHIEEMRCAYAQGFGEGIRFGLEIAK